MKYSLIIPTRNRSHMLRDLLIQTLNQKNIDLSSVEVIIVDDCSDNLEDNLKATQLLDNKVSYKLIRLKEPSGCVSIPRNIGIVNSFGQYILHADDDSWLPLGKLYVLGKLLDNNPDKQFVAGSRLTIDKINVSITEDKIPPNFNPLYGPGIDSCQFMYRRSIYETIPIKFASKACDWNLMKEIASNFIDPFLYIDQITGIYLRHDSNRIYDKDSECD